MRDASANKCGVISSSYEIIANLLMKEEEFLASKEEYVSDVLKILEKRAFQEARLIFRRRNESGGHLFCTSISDNLSREMNEWYGRLFDFLIGSPELLGKPALRRVIESHLPEYIVRHERYRRRIGKMPLKYRAAMVASELASNIVYGEGWDEDFRTKLLEFVKRSFPERRSDTREKRKNAH